MNKYIKIAIGIFIGIVIAGIAYFIFPKSYITMSVAPSKVTLVIDKGNSHTITTGKVSFVIAGTHTYTFSREGFATQTITLNSGNNESKEILLALTPQTNAARNILENDTDASHAVQEKVASIREAEQADAIAKNYPIIAILPYSSHSFEITTCASAKYPNDPSKIALCVYANDPSTIGALVEDTIREKGYNPSSYEIIYKSADSE